MTKTNANKGHTKAALKQRVIDVIAYDVAQFGTGWTLDTLLEIVEEMRRRSS